MPPERTRPVRSPVVPAGFPAPGIGALLDATVGEGLRTAERLAAISDAAVQGAVECGVKTAYTVIDEYMRRGREAAGRHRERSNWRGDMNDDRQNYGNWSTAWGPMWPLMAPWIQAMRVWTTAMSAFVPGAMPQDPWNPYASGGGASPAPPTAKTAPKVSVQVSSQRPTEVIPSVAPGADAMTLVADALRIDDGSGAPSLVGVAITCTPGHVRVSVTVPNDQPAGRYSGAIREAAGMTVGDLTVEVAGPATRRRVRKA